MFYHAVILLSCLLPGCGDSRNVDKNSKATDEVAAATEAFYAALFQGDLQAVRALATTNSQKGADLDVLDAMGLAFKDLDELNDAFSSRFPKEKPLVSIPSASNIRARLSIAKIDIKGSSAVITYQNNTVLELAKVEKKWLVIPDSVLELKAASVKNAHELSAAATDIAKRIKSRQLGTVDAIQRAWGDLLKPDKMLANQMAIQAPGQQIVITGSESETVPGGEIVDFESENSVPGVVAKKRVLTMLILTPGGQPASTNEGGLNEKGVYTEQFVYQTGPKTTKSLAVQLDSARGIITIGSDELKFKTGDVFLVRVDGQWKAKAEQLQDVKTLDVPRIIKERIREKMKGP